MSITHTCIPVPILYRLRLVHYQLHRLIVRLTPPVGGYTARRGYGYKLQKELVYFLVGYSFERCRIPWARSCQVGLVGDHDHRVFVFVAFLHWSALSKLLPPLAQALEGIALGDIENEDDGVGTAEEGGGET
jgi:hypothetical protein